MPAVLDRPVTDIIYTPEVDENKTPLWTLYVMETSTMNFMRVMAILFRILPEFNTERLNAINDELRTRHIAQIMQDIKEKVEPYYLRLQKNDLNVLMEEV